jgi:prevent-host-death family protein
MTSVSVSDAKNNLSALLREVRGGATITITDRGIPVARLVAPASTSGISAAAIDLAQRGRLILPDREPSAEWLELPMPRTLDGSSLVDAVREDRDDDRSEGPGEDR